MLFCIIIFLLFILMIYYCTMYFQRSFCVDVLTTNSIVLFHFLQGSPAILTNFKLHAITNHSRVVSKLVDVSDVT